jgi:hypothetical protein
VPALALRRTAACPQLAGMDRNLRSRLEYAYDDGNCGGHTPDALLAQWRSPVCALCHERQHECAIPFHARDVMCSSEVLHGRMWRPWNLLLAARFPRLRDTMEFL